jgi:hypothetical protein
MHVRCFGKIRQPPRAIRIEERPQDVARHFDGLDASLLFFFGPRIHIRILPRVS